MKRRHSQTRRPCTRAKLSLERLEVRQLLAADGRPLHNSFDPEDVNDDGVCSPVDALIVINELNQPEVRAETNFADVNADGQRSPVDALLVINRLHRGGGRELPEDSGVIVTPHATLEPRSIDGTGNNLENPELGSTGEQLLRVAPADYGDGVSSPAGADRPSPREISNVLVAHEAEPIPNARQTSAFLYVWGQFLDHDLDLTSNQEEDGEEFDIPVPAGDPFFDPEGTGTQVISFTRSQFAPSTGTEAGNPRQQLNELTAWIDGSQIYGSDDETAASLRTFEGGRLIVGDDNLLPTDDEGNFLAGDIRANENIELTSMHTLFVREHNDWADQLATQNPDLGDEAIYQQARAIVIAELQAITYNEFLPALLGRRALSRYEGYDASVDPTIANEFSTAAFRFGHSTINEDVEFFDDDGRAVRDEVELREAFLNPELVRETGIDSILKYVASSQSEELDVQVVDSLRNFLFGAPGQGGLDLASLNIQRGRDHGLADYNTVREAYGLPRVESFDEITSNTEVAQALSDLYGSVDNIDLWVGGIAEDHAPESTVGPLFQRIIADQFERLRDGDRYWYQNLFAGRELRQLERTTLADVLRRNTTITNLQKDVFYMRAEASGLVFADANGNGEQDRREPGVAGVTIELLDDEGNVIASTVTDARGKYRFQDFHETGDYQLRMVPPTDDPTTSDILDVLISRGGLRIGGLDFGLRPSGSVAASTLNEASESQRSQRLAATDAAFDTEELWRIV